MGAEGSIEVFQENELEDELGLLKDESLKEMFDKSVSRMIDVLVHPSRMEYEFDWLKSKCNECEDYQVNEFKFTCTDGVKLQCVKWIRDPNARLCVVYIHTNTRSLCDATELLPLCNLLNANLVAFDQRGAGLSEGQLSFRIVEDLASILDILCADCELDVILWARGMASYIGVQYITQLMDTIEAQKVSSTPNSSDNSIIGNRIKYVVLDTPFTSLKDVVLDIASRIDFLGSTVPPMFVKFALYIFKSKIQESLQVDPYSISPLHWVSNRPKSRQGDPIPCYVLSADCDEYTPSWMGLKLAEEWKKVGLGPSWYREFPGTHFEEREECLVMTPLQSIMDHLGLNGDQDLYVQKATSSDRATSNQQTGLEYAPKWHEEENVSKCEHCTCVFSVLNRKHHCRRCGHVVCSKCSSSRRKVPRRNCLTPSGQGTERSDELILVRVCDKCANVLDISF